MDCNQTEKNQFWNQNPNKKWLIGTQNRKSFFFLL